MSRKVLITGASGFIGRQTIAPLLTRDWEVHAVGNLATDDRARWYRCDLLDPLSRRQLVSSIRPDAMLHCAWVTRNFWSAPENLDWVSASLDLLRLAAGQGAKRILVTGSCAEYDWSAPQPRPWREDDPTAPANLYGTAKHALHQLAASFAGVAGLELVWARLFHLYGPHEAPGRLVPSLIDALRAGRRVETGPADTTRDLLHTADAGRALAALLSGTATGAVNVASGAPVRIGSVAEMLARLAGRPDLLALGARDTAEPRVIVADTTRLRALTGFTPLIGLHDGLAQLWGGVVLRRATKTADPYDIAADLYRQDRLDAAEQAALAIIATQPDHAPAINLAGVIYRRTARFEEARDMLARAAELDPGRDLPWINLGNVHLDLEDAEAAASAYARAAAAAPDSPDATRLWGNALARAGHTAEGLARLDAALALCEARHADPLPTLSDRARARYAGGDVPGALDDVTRALVRAPNEAGLVVLKAQILRLSGDLPTARSLLLALVEARPQDATAHVALADTLLAEENRDAANAHYRQAVSLAPDDITRGKLCWSLLNTRTGDEAAHIAEAAGIARSMVSTGRVHPGSAHSLQSALLRVADFEGLADFDRCFPDRQALLGYWVRRNTAGALHAQLSRVATLQERLDLVDWHRRWGDQIQALTPPLPNIHPRRRPPASRIRVGLMSSDLRNHPVSYFALPIFDHHDRDRFELYCYSFHPGRADPIQAEIAGKTHAFRTLSGRPDAEVAATIAADELDILFELGGSTHLNRIELMAHRPAPIQASWLGYPHSAGLDRIDHILVDPWLRPADPRLLLETPFEMPHSWVSLGRIGFTDHPIAPGLPQDRSGRITFGTMNNPYKFTPRCIALWAQVMQAVPGSRFLFVRPESGSALFRDNMSRAFARHGIAPDRLEHRAVRGNHMRWYNDIDIALDTAPQTGGTTTCETIWMGVPVITLVGPAFFERLSYSNLINAGLGELATHNEAGYIATAAALAGDRARLLAWRHGLRDQIRASPLGDQRRWVDDLQTGIETRLAMTNR